MSYFSGKMVTFRLEDTSEKTVCGVTSIQEKLRVFELHFQVFGSNFQVLIYIFRVSFEFSGLIL